MRKLFVLILLVACSRETPEARVQPPKQKPVVLPSPVEKIEHGAFVVTHDGKALYREQFARSAHRLECDIAASGGNDRVLQAIDLNDDASVRTSTIHVLGGAGRTESMSFVMQGTQAVVRVVGMNGVPVDKVIEVPQGTIPNPVPESLAILEQVIRRAKAIGGPSVRVPVLPGTLRAQWVFVETTGPDTVKVRSASATIEARIDAEGRLLSASEPNQKIAIQRE